MAKFGGGLLFNCRVQTKVLNYHNNNNNFFPSHPRVTLPIRGVLSQLCTQTILINEYATLERRRKVNSNINNCHSVVHFSTGNKLSLEASIERERKKEIARTTISPKSKFVIAAHKYIVDGYSFITYPLSWLRQDPYDKLYKHNASKTRMSDKIPNAWFSILWSSPGSSRIMNSDLATLTMVFDYIFTTYHDKPCLGTRPTIKEQLVKDDNGGQILKRELGPYEWKTFEEVRKLRDLFSKGIIKVLGLKPQQRIAILADTREEWFITAIAALKSNLSIVSIPTTMQDKDIVTALKETQVDTLFTTVDLGGRCSKIVGQTPDMKRLIYMDYSSSENKNPVTFPKTVQVYNVPDLLAEARTIVNIIVDTYTGNEEDTAIILYTPGSTKGVILSHDNVISAVCGVADTWFSGGLGVGKRRTFKDEDGDDEEIQESYLAVDSLADVLGFASLINSLLQGARIGFGTPTTMLDKAVGLMNDTKCDAVALKPSVIYGSPEILEMIMDAEKAKLAKDSAARQDLINYFFEFKMKWHRKGFDTRLLNRLLYNKMKKSLGGEVRLIVCGGKEPLNPKTQELLRAIFCTKLLPGYGRPETSGCALFSKGNDLSTGRVGLPLVNATVKLVDRQVGQEWYRVTDKPFPRGELCISGSVVAQGYVGQPNGDENFVVEGEERFFKTGDIAEVHNDGVIQILRRRN